MAGAPGFEPGNGGIKIRCLTTWLRPIGPVMSNSCFAWTRGGPQLYSEGHLAAILAASPARQAVLAGQRHGRYNARSPDAIPWDIDGTHDQPTSWGIAALSSKD